MYKKAIVALLLALCGTVAFGQAKPRLAILPFTGGTGGDGETIASLFSNEKEIQEMFILIPRTAVNALVAEQNFQMSGYTDPDTIVRLGRLLNADFVVSGHIRRLGNSNLIIATIVNVETFEQMAGDYRTYRNIEKVPSLLPAIVEKMIAASRRDTASLPKLAIPSFKVANTGVNLHDAETLAQILAVEIGNTGKYSVLPRTATMQTALQELEYQMSGSTADEDAKSPGRAINAEYVLSAEVRNLGKMNMFTASILHLEKGNQVTSDRRDYRVIDDGIQLMEELAVLLTDPDGAEKRISTLNRERSAKYWTLGTSVGTSFTAPWVVGTVRGTLAPFKYSFLEFGLDFGLISGIKDVDYYSLYPFIHYDVFLPFRKSGGWYAGVGGGYMLGEFTFPTGKVNENIFAFDFTSGVNIGNVLDISYTLRTDFKSAGHKVAVGYTYRFK